MPTLRERCWDALPKISAAIRAFRAGSMVSGPSTIGINAVGTGAYVATKAPRSLGAVPLDIAASLVTGRRTHFLSDVAAEVWGLGKALPPALKATGRRARATREIDELQQNAVPGLVGAALRVPFKALSIPDQFWYDRAFHSEMMKLAQREAVKTKSSWSKVMAGQAQIAERVAKLIDQEKGLKDFIKAAKRTATREEGAQLRALDGEINAHLAQSFMPKAQMMAERSIFTAREGGNLDKSLDALDLMAQHNPLVNIIFPFRRTPANVVRETLRSTPLGAVWGGMRALKAAQAGVDPALIQERLVDDMSQAFLGTAAMYYFIHLAANDQIKVNPFKTAAPAERATEEAAGILPDTVQVGDWSVPVSRLEPFGSMLLNAGRAVEGFRAGQNPDSIAEDLFKTTENMLLISAKETWLDPLAEFTEAIQDDKSLAKYMQGIGATFVPRAISMADQTIKESPADASLSQGGNLVAGFRSKLPGQGETKLGLFGAERVSQAPWASRFLGRTGHIGNDPLAQEMVRIGSYHLPPAGLDPADRQKLGITLGEDRLMRVTKGRAQKMLVQQVVGSAQYQQLPPTPQGDVMRKKMIDYAFRQASDGINQRVKALKMAKMPLTSRAILGR